MGGIQKNNIWFGQRIALFFIVSYQKLLSPDHSWLSMYFPYGYCRFHPTCSEYTAEAIRKYGILSGVMKGFSRILRCHPWAEPRIDHVD